MDINKRIFEEVEDSSEEEYTEVETIKKEPKIPVQKTSLPKKETETVADVHNWTLARGVTVELRSNTTLLPQHFERLAKYVELAKEAAEDEASDQEIGEEQGDEI